MLAHWGCASYMSSGQTRPSYQHVGAAASLAGTTIPVPAGATKAMVPQQIGRCESRPVGSSLSYQTKTFTLPSFFLFGRRVLSKAAHFFPQEITQEHGLLASDRLPCCFAKSVGATLPALPSRSVPFALRRTVQ